jgi:hypothetical protein
MAHQLLFKVVTEYQSIMNVTAHKITLAHMYRDESLADISALPPAVFFYPDRHISWLKKYG